MRKPVSLRLRLMIGMVLLTLLCGGTASLQSWFQTRDNVDELFDTQQLLFARRLATIDPHNLITNSNQLKKTKKLVRHHHGDFDDDVLAFAIFTRDGQPVVNDGDHGRKIRFRGDRDGFTDDRLTDDDDRWRIVWLNSADGNYRIAVGQKGEYRQDMTTDIVSANLAPWLFALPVMLVLLFWLITRELTPLRRLTEALQHRSPDAAEPLSTARIPSEVMPLVKVLNNLFARTAQMIGRERRFISDAAHELRSPLSALRVQTEVAQLADDDATARNHALNNLTTGIDRATRLVDQLLTLSRLDHSDALETSNLRLQDVLEQAIVEQYAAAEMGKITLELDAPAVSVRLRGNLLLISLLVRNLLDNAIRYSRPDGRVTLRLANGELQVLDEGPGVSEDDLARIGERFFRPPGQEKPGSGLGLSIVRQIGQLHGMQLTLANRPQGGFSVSLRWSS